MQNGLDVNKFLRRDSRDVMSHGKYQLINDRYSPELCLFREYNGTVSLQTYDESRQEGFVWYLRYSGNPDQ